MCCRQAPLFAMETWIARDGKVHMVGLKTPARSRPSPSINKPKCVWSVTIIMSEDIVRSEDVIPEFRDRIRCAPFLLFLHLAYSFFAKSLVAHFFCRVCIIASFFFQWPSPLSSNTIWTGLCNRMDIVKVSPKPYNALILFLLAQRMRAPYRLLRLVEFQVIINMV